MSNLARTSSTGVIRTSSIPVHMCDRRIDLFGSGLNAEERDQFIDRRSGSSVSLAKLIRWTELRDVLDKPFSMFQKRTL